MRNAGLEETQAESGNRDSDIESRHMAQWEKEGVG